MIEGVEVGRGYYTALAEAVIAYEEGNFEEGKLRLTERAWKCFWCSVSVDDHYVSVKIGRDKTGEVRFHKSCLDELANRKD